MSGIIIEPATSIDAIERNFARLNEAVVALQGGSIAIENIEGYENLATKLYVEDEIETVRYAVGDVHISETDTNPEEKFGYGKWSFISKGRCLVGIDVEPEKDDPDYDPEYEVDQDFQTPGQTGGEKEHVLTVEEMPAHDHAQGAGEEYPALGYDGTTKYRNHSVGDSEGKFALTHKSGGDQPHNNLQPYYCVYIWKRTE